MVDRVEGNRQTTVEISEQLKGGSSDGNGFRIVSTGINGGQNGRTTEDKEGLVRVE